jgi:putative ABC transport system ATP-binding protein
VRCHDIHKSFGTGEAKVDVLRGIDFTAAMGEMTFLVGPSGCGKTTLISVIAGLLEATSGRVELFDTEVAALSSRHRILFRRKNLGFVFQQYNLLPSLSAAENAAVPLLAAGMPRRAALDKASQLLDRLGLGNRTRALPKILSGGQQQRVALARALVHEPRLVICDEPTAALDAESGHSVMELLSRTAVHPDRAVIVVSHDNRVFHFADRLAYMNDGSITKTESQVAWSV